MGSTGKNGAKNTSSKMRVPETAGAVVVAVHLNQVCAVLFAQFVRELVVSGSLEEVRKISGHVTAFRGVDLSSFASRASHQEGAFRRREVTCTLTCIRSRLMWHMRVTRGGLVHQLHRSRGEIQVTRVADIACFYTHSMMYIVDAGSVCSTVCSTYRSMNRRTERLDGVGAVIYTSCMLILIENNGTLPLQEL